MEMVGYFNDVTLVRIGKITEGKEGKPDTTFVMLDEDLVQLAAGKLNPQNAFMTVSRKL